MKEHLLVVDIGTQSLRASIIDKDGNTIVFSQKKYETPYFSVKEGFAEQDADYYMDVLAEATTEIYEKEPEALNTISGMVMVSFRDSSLILDKDLKPIRPAVLWLDQRITRIPKMKNLKWYEKLIFKVVGMTDTAKYNAERTITYWLMENEKENWEKMAHFVPLSTYFNYKVCGNLVLSTADCAGHYPFNFKKGKWFSKLHPKTDVFSIPTETLPELVKAGGELGKVTHEFSVKSHIPEGTVLIASGSDKSCETLGNGCIDKTKASISLGTACTIDIVDSKYSEPETFLPSYQAPYPNAFDLEVQIYRGMWMVRWYLDNFGANDMIEAKEKGMSVEDYLASEMEKIPCGCDGLVLQPYWGPGLKRPNAKGSIVGFSGVHTRHHLYRAIFEGIAFALREGMETIMKKTKRKPDCLVVSGGGSRSSFMCHILVDVFNLPVVCSATSESSSLGGAMSGFLSLGIFPNEKEAVKSMVREGEEIKPIPEHHRLYEKVYQKIYLKMYPKMKSVYDSCKNFYLDEKKD